MKTKNLFIVGAITAVFSLFSQQTNAQFSKGGWLVEGSVGGISINNGKSEYKDTGVLSSSNKSSGFSMSIYPTAGYFITDKFVVGASLDISFSNSKYDYSNNLGQKTSDSKSNNSSLGLGTFLNL